MLWVDTLSDILRFCDQDVRAGMHENVPDRVPADRRCQSLLKD